MKLKTDLIWSGALSVFDAEGLLQIEKALSHGCPYQLLIGLQGQSQSVDVIYNGGCQGLGVVHVHVVIRGWNYVHSAC